jgi:hypothetical protein
MAREQRNQSQHSMAVVHAPLTAHTSTSALPFNQKLPTQVLQ